MKVHDYLARVAHIAHSDIPDDNGEVYLSNFDNSYIARVGMEDNIKALADREITEELTHGAGYSPKENRWYGWSHKAIYGFEIGSTCKKGDCHYRAANEAGEIEAAVAFWSDENHIGVKAEKVKDGLLHISWNYSEDTPNKKLVNKTGGADWEYNPDNFGRGEWAAKTMEDAKQMAIDFNNGVS
jgi:hypothetical protein